MEYKLPTGWKWCKQNEVCRLTDGEKKNDVSYPYLEVKYLRGKKEKEFVTSGKFIKAGTKVILVDGENSGEVFTVPEDGFMGSTFKALSIQNVDEKYLQFFIQTKKDLYRNNKKGSAIPHLNKELFFNMPFPLPPTLAEQQRIVNRIETMFEKLDQAQEKAQAVLDSFETCKAAILHKAFIGELTVNWRKENGVPDDSWISVNMGALSELITKGASPKWQGIQYTDDTSQTLFVTSENVREGYLDLEKEKYLDNKINEIQKRSVLKKGDVLLNIVGASIGRSAIYNLDKLANTNQAVCIIRLNKTVLGDFICYFLNSNIARSYYDDNKVETARANISLANVFDMIVAVPTLPEQQQIVRILDTVLEKEFRAKEAAQTVLDQIALLKKSILARAFRGKI